MHGGRAIGGKARRLPSIRGEQFDLTSTCFETDEDRGPHELRRFGYSRGKRCDCRQVVIALIVTPQGFAPSYEVMGGGTADSTTLIGFPESMPAATWLPSGKGMGGNLGA